MKLTFTKMHGAGNDFMVVDATRQPFPLTEEQIQQLADRHFGIGFDQLLVVEVAENPENDFRYRIFNADGGEVGQCGNGARCFARYVKDHGLTDKNELQVETMHGVMRPVIEEDGEVRVELARPAFAPADIPMSFHQEQTTYQIDALDDTYTFGAVNLGNPHAVIVVDDVNSTPVESLGPEIESHSLFPERINVGFMQILTRHYIRLRVYERGSGETLACGSGACAAAIVGIEQGLLDDHVTVEVAGGKLHVDWKGRGYPVYLKGPAVTVFEGQIEL